MNQDKTSKQAAINILLFWITTKVGSLEDQIQEFLLHLVYFILA